MPPKISSSTTAKADKSNKEASEAINTYISQKPDFEKLIKEAKENPSRPPTDTRQTEYSLKVKAAVKEVWEERRAQAERKSKTTTMPNHPKENNIESNTTEKLTQETESSSSNQKAKFEHHTANPGPVIAENLGPKATKEELKKRAEELNKK